MPRPPTIEERLKREASLEISHASADALRLQDLMIQARPDERDVYAAQAEAALERLKAAEAIMKKVAPK